MATSVSLAGFTYSVPSYGDSGWASGTGNLSSYLVAIANVTLQTTGGNFTLTAPLNFGAGYGITALSFTTYAGAPITAWYSQAFTMQTSVTVTHNLGHYPIIQVIDNGGNLTEPNSLNHTSVNAFVVTFSPALSGTVLYVG